MRWLNLFFQANCPLCGRSTPASLCSDCDRQIVACRQQLFHQTHDGLSLFCWGIYEGALKRAIAACKYDNHPELATLFGAKMAIAWRQHPQAQKLGKLPVVPIPLHAQKLRERGFNQAEVMARSFCEGTGMPCAPQYLQRIKYTKPQMETRSKQEREENLHQAFITPLSKTKSLSVVLLDDIYTSGVTMREAIAVLKAANMRVSGAIVLARPPFGLA